MYMYTQQKWRGILKPLSQLVPGRFKTLCDRNFNNSYVLSLPLLDASHLFYAIKWSHQITSDFWTCSKFRGNTRHFNLLHWVSRTFAQPCTTLCRLTRVLCEFLRSQDDSHLCMRVLYDHESVIRHVAYDLATCTTVARHLPTSINTLYQQAIFQIRLDFQERIMDAAVPIPPWCMCWISDYNYYPPSASTRTMARMIVRSPYV